MPQRRLVMGLSAALLLSVIGMFGFSALLPAFIAEWRLSNAEAGWLNGIFHGAYAVAGLVLVTLSDRVEPKRLLAASAGVGALAYAGFALWADGFWSATLLRGLAGIALAGFYLPGVAVIGEHLAGPAQTRATSRYVATFAFGAGVSLAAMGEVGAVLGWRGAIGIAGLASALAAPLAWWSIPARAAMPPRPPTRFLDLRPVLRTPESRAYALAYGGHMWEMLGARGWLVAFFAYAAAGQAGGGWAPTPATLAGATGVVGMLGTVLAGELATRFGPRRVSLAFLLASGATTAAVGYAAALPYGLLVLLVVAQSVIVVGDAATLGAGAAASASPGYRGATMAVYGFVGALAAFLGPLAFGVVLDLAGGRDRPAAWGAAFAVLGLGALAGAFALRRPAARA